MNKHVIIVANGVNGKILSVVQIPNDYIITWYIVMYFCDII